MTSTAAFNVHGDRPKTVTSLSNLGPYQCDWGRIEDQFREESTKRKNTIVRVLSVIW